ncbi:LOW QUALITY PROTEIN: serine/arginine-rich splicing factor RS41 [Asparagus officinalis]|uniref:LOW QUALITY PROTEIN: serine/arginine-rich splicing factor RS41 n=1 Tax=Asparagus officinalis TaxID=4686 RepID=UPI00098E6692|nr:LOW QUALITY PROTEIN: serine/arginine-rich splicing factor RS41 [Asparagus officinalis]
MTRVARTANSMDDLMGYAMEYLGGVIPHNAYSGIIQIISSIGDNSGARQSSVQNLKPVICGNFEHDARQSELERRLGRYGKVDRVNIKAGFALIYMEDERDAEDAIRGLDRIQFGRHGRRLRVEWTKEERGGRMSGGERRSSANSRPSKTLFVINFDPVSTRIRDLERHFEPYVKVLNVRIRRNFAFIQFESQDDATKALEATDVSKIIDRVMSVEYAARDDDERRHGDEKINGYSQDRREERSPERRSRDRGRSASPYGRGVESRGAKWACYGVLRFVMQNSNGVLSPYSKPEEQGGSPNYGRAESPAYDRHRSHSAPPRTQRGELTDLLDPSLTKRIAERG